jgi:hypothetical protein
MTHLNSCPSASILREFRSAARSAETDCFRRHPHGLGTTPRFGAGPGVGALKLFWELSGRGAGLNHLLDSHAMDSYDKSFCLKVLAASMPVGKLCFRRFPSSCAITGLIAANGQPPFRGGASASDTICSRRPDQIWIAKLCLRVARRSKGTRLPLPAR